MKRVDSESKIALMYYMTFNLTLPCTCAKACAAWNKDLADPAAPANQDRHSRASQPLRR